MVPLCHLVTATALWICEADFAPANRQRFRWAGCSVYFHQWAVSSSKPRVAGSVQGRRGPRPVYTAPVVPVVDQKTVRLGRVTKETRFRLFRVAASEFRRCKTDLTVGARRVLLGVMAEQMPRWPCAAGCFTQQGGSTGVDGRPQTGPCGGPSFGCRDCSGYSTTCEKAVDFRSHFGCGRIDRWCLMG